MPTTARSWPTRSSTRRTLRGRPTLMGTTLAGNTTLLRNGRIGKSSSSEERGSLMVERHNAKMPAVPSKGHRHARNDPAMRRFGPMLFAVLVTACASQQATDPASVLRAYARALEEGRADDAYRALSDEARRGISLEA